MSLELFHPVIQQWFRGRFAAPTEPQELGWPDLVAGRDVLIAAPTGSGKTLTAFLAAIDRLLRAMNHPGSGSAVLWAAFSNSYRLCRPNRCCLRDGEFVGSMSS